MELDMDHTKNQLMGSVGKLARKFIYRVLSSNGPIPDHFAFILDGNRRYARKWKLEEGGGHRAGFISLLGICRYLYEMGVKYITVYAFSIDNFRRKPHFVQFLMELLLYKTEILLQQTDILNVYGIKILFIGTLKHLKKPVQEAAQKLTEATRNNNKAYLLVCLSYTSTDEIVRAVEASCKEKTEEFQAQKGKISCNGVLTKFNGHAGNEFLELNGSSKNFHASEEDQFPVIKLTDIERHIYMGVASDPCLLVRTSGETRLSNYLLWQTSHCILYSPETLWPEIGFWDIFWSVILWQRHYSYLEKKIKQP